MVNAVAHRDYNLTGARVIIKRNPILMKVLSKVKYVEEVGEGWDRIIEEIKNHLLKPKEPKIDDTSLSVTVIIYSLEEFEFVDMDLNERQKKIIKFIQENGRITTSQCAGLLNVSNDTALRELSKLRSRGLVKQKGIGREIYYVIK